MLRRLTICVAVVLCAVASGGAQAPNLPIKLIPESGEDLGPGKIAVAKGTASSTQVRFALDGLDVSQPITVTIASTDASKVIDLVVAKDNYDDPQQTARTDSDGTATIEMRTQGDFGIGVVAATPVDFILAVWIGDITPDDTQPFLSPVKDYDAASLAKLPGVVGGVEAAAVTPAAAAGPGLFGWAAIGVGAVIAIGLVMIGIGMLKRKQEPSQ